MGEPVRGLFQFYRGLFYVNKEPTEFSLVLSYRACDVWWCMDICSILFALWCSRRLSLTEVFSVRSDTTQNMTPHIGVYDEVNNKEETEAYLWKEGQLDSQSKGPRGKHFHITTPSHYKPMRMTTLYNEITITGTYIPQVWQSLALSVSIACVCKLWLATDAQLNT